VTVVDGARLLGRPLDEEVEGVTDELHLVKSLVDRHRYGLVKLLTNDDGGVSQLRFDGDARLAAHVAHCVAKSTPMGDLVSKDKRMSSRKIDAAVAAIVANDRAAHHAGKTRRKAAAFR